MEGPRRGVGSRLHPLWDKATVFARTLASGWGHCSHTRASADILPMPFSMQTAISHAFRDCTVLTIAHRLHTIIDADKVLVLEAGQVAEFAAPSVLLADSTSAFAALARSAAGNHASLKLEFAASNRRAECT